MKKVYRDYLEKAARQTILIHRADTLIRLILRTIVRDLNLEHAGMFIYDEKYKEYVVKISRGRPGNKVPSGFVKIEKNNPLIRYFTDAKLEFEKQHLLWDRIVYLLKSPRLNRSKWKRAFLEDVKFNLSLYGAKACIPGFFRKDLIAILFLGDKRDKKKIDNEELGFLSVLASDVVMSLKNAWLIEDLNNQLKINKRLFLQIVSALSKSIEAKDKYTIGHTERVVNHSLGIARNLKKYLKIVQWEKFEEDLKIAALLHDIGKIGIPEKILDKSTCLNERERCIIEQHPIIGTNILGKIEEFKDVLLGVKFHHERYDGTGYPLGLRNKQIPLIAQIISLADAFDAMIISRPYRPALTIKEAIREIKRNRKKQFAPDIVDAFLKIYSQHK